MDELYRQGSAKPSVAASNMLRTIFTFFLLLLATCIAAAQGRVIDEETYNKEIRASGEYRLTEKYREKRTTKSSIPGPETLEISEVEPPNKRRLTMFRLDRNPNEPSAVWIIIGDKAYVKRQGSGWQVEDVRAPVDFTGPTPTNLTGVEFRDLGIDPESSMRVLQRTKHTILKLNGESIDNIQTVKSWIDRTGRLSKEEYKSTNAKSGTSVLTMHYEVDPTIKIEAPITQ